MKIRFFAFKRLYSLVFWSIFSLSVVQCRTSDSREAPIAEQVPTHSGFALQDLGSAQRYYLSREPFLCQGSQFALSQALIPVENKLQRASVQDRALQFQVYEGLAALDPGLLVFLGHLKTRVILQDNIDRECGLKDARACWTQGVAETRIYLSPFYQQNFHGTVLNHLPVLQAAEILFDSVGELDDRFVRDPQDDFSKKVQELAVIAVTEYKNRYPEASVSILDAREVFAHLLFTASCNASWVEYTQANFPASFAALQTLQAQLRAVYQGESSYGLVHKGLRPSRLKLQSKDLLGGRTPVEESEEDLSKMISHALETPLGTPRGTRASKTIMGPEDVKAWTSPVSPLDDNLLTPRSMSREDSDRYAFRRGLPKLTDVRQQSEDKLVRTPISALIKGKTKCCAYEGTPLLVAPSKSAVYSAEGGTPSDVVTILVHGTFSPHAVTKANGWANPDGLFADHIRREWGGDVLSFMWTGKQDAKSREDAGLYLSQKIRALSKEGAQVRIVSHSHGGNVVLHAASFLNKFKGEGQGVSIAQFHSIARPNRDGEVGRSVEADRAIQWMGNYSSKSDPIQALGSDIKSLFLQKYRVDRAADENIIFSEKVKYSHADMHRGTLLNLLSAKGNEVAKVNASPTKLSQDPALLEQLRELFGDVEGE